MGKEKERRSRKEERGGGGQLAKCVCVILGRSTFLPDFGDKDSWPAPKILSFRFRVPNLVRGSERSGVTDERQEPRWHHSQSGEYRFTSTSPSCRSAYVLEGAACCLVPCIIIRLQRHSTQYLEHLNRSSIGIVSFVRIQHCPLRHLFLSPPFSRSQCRRVVVKSSPSLMHQLHDMP